MINICIFGRCAAKLDDVANYIPARLSGWLMVAASAFVKMDVKNAAKIYRRDRRNHASPNSAQTEAAMQVRWRYSLQAMLLFRKAL